MEETREKSRIGSRNLVPCRCRESISVSQAARPAISMCKTYEIKVRRHGGKQEERREDAARRQAISRIEEKRRRRRNRRNPNEHPKSPAQSVHGGDDAALEEEGQRGGV